MPHRFFVPANWITPPAVSLRDDIARQISTVLRMEPDDKIVVLDNSGLEFEVVLTAVGKRAVQGEIVGQQPAQGEPKTEIILYQGMLKGQKFEWVLQKGTELGVVRFVPTICRRSIVRNEAAINKKKARWQQIIREAAEQSGRGRLPQLAAPVPLDQAVVQAVRTTPLVLMPWEETTGASLKQALPDGPAKIAVFIGPEGGFTAEEVAQAKANGARLITLGPRILRAETAGLAVCAAILYALDEWE